MAEPQKQPSERAQETPPPAARVSRLSWPRFLLYMLTGLLPVLVLARFQSSFTLRPPAPPQVARQHLDPAVASLLQETTRAVETRPKFDRAWGNLGMALELYGFKPEAVVCFEQARKLNPKEPRWPYFLSRLWLVEQPEKALPALRDSVQRCRNEPDYPRLRLAQLLIERNLLREGEANFQALIDHRPDHAAAHLGLARLAGLRDDWNEASRHLAFALTNLATARSAYLLLAAIQLRQGNVPGAETARRVAAAQPPDQDWPDPFQTEAMQFKLGLRALVEQGQQLLQQNRLREAEEIATRLFGTYPAAAEGWLYRGRVALVENRLADATTALTRHLEMEPNSVDGHQQMGVLLFRKQQEEESIRHFQEAIRLKPDALEAHYNLGLVELQRTRPREAMPAFRNAIRCQPAFIDAYLALAAAAEQSGQREEAAATLRQAMEVNPYDLRVQEELERLTKLP